jgi:hypothetical protein
MGLAASLKKHNPTEPHTSAKCLSGENHLHNFAVSFLLRFDASAPISIHGCADGSVAHEALLHPGIRSTLVQKTTVGMSEGMSKLLEMHWPLEHLNNELIDLAFNHYVPRYLDTSTIEEFLEQCKIDSGDVPIDEP